MGSSRTSGGEAAGGLDRPLLPAKPAAAVRKAAEVVLRIQGGIGAGVVAVMAILLVMQVVVRYVLPVPMFWVEEVARLAMIWMTMLGVGYAVGRGIHLTVTAPTDYLPVAARRWAQWASLVLIAVAAAVLVVASAELVDTLGSVTASSSSVPRAVYFLASVVGYALAVAQSTLALLAGPNREVPEIEDELGSTGENS